MGSIRVGFGFDVHQLREAHPFILGGVNLEHHSGAFGHSDADVLVHAICDALLGATNLRDIGFHFSNKDQRWKGVSSLLLLKHVMQLLTDLNEQGTTIIMVTHSEHDARYTHRVINMLDGQIVTQNIKI